MLSHCLLDFSVGVGAFVIEPSQISSLFSFDDDHHNGNANDAYDRDNSAYVDVLNLK